MNDNTSLTLTIDQLITLLEDAKARVGGDTPVFVSDYPGEAACVDSETTGMNPADSGFYIGI